MIISPLKDLSCISGKIINYIHAEILKLAVVGLDSLIEAATNGKLWVCYSSEVHIKHDRECLAVDLHPWNIIQQIHVTKYSYRVIIIKYSKHVIY